MSRLHHAAAVFLDLDGTTLRPDHSVSPAMCAAVGSARAAGVHVVLCSSRSPAGIGLVQDRLGSAGDLMVAFQGGMIAAWDGGTVTVHRETTIPVEAVQAIEGAAGAAGLTISAYAGLDWRCLREDDVIVHAGVITREQARVVTELADPRSPVHKLLVIAPDPGRLAALAALEAALPGTVSASRSHADYLEIAAAGTDKGTGLLAACDVLGIDPRDTVAVGDGPNDLPMLAAAGHAIVMGQAAPPVRAVADLVIGDNTTDDLAACLRDLGPLSHHRVRSSS